MRGIVHIGLIVGLCAIPLLADVEQGQPAQPPRIVPLEISGAGGVASVAVFMNATKVGDVAIAPNGAGSTVLSFANFPKPEVLLFIEKCRDGVRIRIFSNGDVMPTDEDCERDAVGPLFKWDCMRRLQINIGQVSRSVVGCGIPQWVKFVAPAPLIPLLMLGGDDPPTTGTTPNPPTGTTPQPPAPPPTNTTNPNPTPPSPPTNTWNYRCTACRASSDPSRHEPALQFCTQMNGTFGVTVNGSSMTITHPPPFVNLSGTIANNMFSGNGAGPIGSFPNVTVRGQGPYQPGASTFQLTLVIGENGAFPGGAPFTVVLDFGSQ